jgi:hypothetical protein
MREFEYEVWTKVKGVVKIPAHSETEANDIMSRFPAEQVDWSNPTEIDGFDLVHQS